MIKLLYFNNIHNSVCLASHISERWSLVLELSLTSYINSTLNQYPGDKMSNVLTTKKKWQLWDLIEVLANLTVVIVLQYINVSDQHTVDLLSLNVPDPLWPHGQQHARPPCPSLTPRVCSNSCLLRQWCCPTISSSATLFSFWLQSFPASRSFPLSAVSIRWPKYWNVSFSMSASNEYSGLVSFRIDWFDLLAIRGTFKSLFQHPSLKASILHHSAFFMVQISWILCPWNSPSKNTGVGCYSLFQGF